MQECLSEVTFEPKLDEVRLNSFPSLPTPPPSFSVPPCPRPPPLAHEALYPSQTSCPHPTSGHSIPGRGTGSAKALWREPAGPACATSGHQRRQERMREVEVAAWPRVALGSCCTGAGRTWCRGVVSAGFSFRGSPLAAQGSHLRVGRGVPESGIFIERAQHHTGLGRVWVTHFFFNSTFSAVERAGRRGRNRQEAGLRDLGTRREGSLCT